MREARARRRERGAVVENSAITFNAYRNLAGDVVPADTYKRNGQRVPRFSPQEIDMPNTPRAHSTTILRVLSAGLNRIERRTWWRILDGWSIDAIAAAERVERAAIYSRIRGSGSKGNGGMVKKNPWVARWWEARKFSQPL